MTSKPFIVETRRRVSKPGDPIRSGSAEPPPATRDDARRTATERAVEFRAQGDGSEHAIIGVVHVATVRPSNHPRAQATYWFHLPDLPAVGQPAATMDKARGAVRFKVGCWFEATGHVLNARGQIRLIREGR